MALKAARLLQQQGPDKAFPVFDDKTGAFHDRDLYVMVYDTAGKNVAHGANPALIGKDLIDLKDTDGKFMIRELVSVKDQGFVDYKWPNPLTKKIEPKTTYVVRVGGYLVGVGAYK
jgi:signal transduction histidine kinase